MGEWGWLSTKLPHVQAGEMAQTPIPDLVGVTSSRARASQTESLSKSSLRALRGILFYRWGN